MNAEPKLSFFRKRALQHPVSTFLFLQLLMGLTAKNLEQKSELLKISPNDESLLGLVFIGAICATYKILKEDYLKLSYCAAFLQNTAQKLAEMSAPYREQGTELLSKAYDSTRPITIACYQSLYETLAPGSVPCIEKTAEHLQASTVDSHEFRPDKV